MAWWIHGSTVTNKTPVLSSSFARLSQNTQLTASLIWPRTDVVHLHLKLLHLLLLFRVIEGCLCWLYTKIQSALQKEISIMATSEHPNFGEEQWGIRNQNVHHDFLKDIFRLISCLFPRGSMCLFSHLKNCWHLLNCILCQFFIYCPILSTDLETARCPLEWGLC